MAIARRDVLGVGAAVAISVLGAACSSAGRDGADPRGQRRQDFPGRPPPGHLYYGAAVPFGRSVPDWEAALGSALAVHRSYFTPDDNETVQLVRQCRDDLRHGRLPHVSIKPPGTWEDIARGEHDVWLRSVLRPLGSQAGPVFLTVHHEPENDAGPEGMLPDDFVAMQSRVIAMAGDLAPQVTIVPVLQHWTFDPSREDADPSAWIVSDASVMGLDVYNPWSPTNGRPWRSFASKVGEVASWFEDTPMVIGEYGCREDPEDPGRAAEWLRDAAEYARSHHIVAMSYFNSGTNSPEGSWALSGESEEAFADLLASDWVARPN